MRTNGGLQRVSALISYVSLTGFLTDLAIRLAVGVYDWKRAALDADTLWLVGIGGLILGLPHLVRPAPAAAEIGWPTSPFQWEAARAYGLVRRLRLPFEGERVFRVTA